MAISSAGLGSGLDVSGIISKLMQVESQPLTALDTKEASYQAKLTAYGGLKGVLSGFQTAVRALSDPTKFQTLKATPSDSAVVTSSAASNAVAGTYALNISKIAQSQKLVAAGQSSASAAIGAGSTTTLTFDFGTIGGGTFTAYDSGAGTGGTYSGSTFTANGSGAKTVTINSSNNTLTGIRDAINAAKIGVTATIVNDGGTSPYRLVLSSDNAGKTNSLRVSVTGEAAISDLLAHDPAGTQKLQETVTGQNTELTVNGVFVSKASTTLTDVVQGVTLTALKTGTANVTVARDTTAVSTAVNAFAKAYNDLNKALKDLTAYDAVNKKASVLTGDATVRSIQSQIRSVLNGALPSGGTYINLSQVGLTFKSDGTLSVDTTKLSSALTSNPSAVAAVFAATGSASDSLVSYVGSTSKTKAGLYALDVSQLATQGTLVGSGAIGSLTITAGVDDTLNVTVDGVSTAVTLAARTYASNAELATEVQSKINGASVFSNAGTSVTVAESAGVLTITSGRYGSASSVAVSGSGAANLLGTPTATAGVDVAGTIGGASGTGSGQNLTGTGISGADGLKLLISGGLTGMRGTVNFSQGYAYQIDKLIDGMLGTSGTLASKTEGINRSIKDINSRRDVLNRRLADVEARYRKQFTALDTLVSNMNQTSAYLSQQLANLPSAG